MKLLSMLVILVCSVSVSSAQWTPLNSGITDSLRAVYFLNEYQGWACGTNSTGNCPILKTTDAGATWSLINYPTMHELRGIYFMDPDTGIIAGFGGLILRSTDGGATWDSIPSGTTKSLRSLWFSSPDTGYACGGAGTIIKTTDGGLTWSPQVSGVSGELVSIRFLNNDLGYAVRKIAGDYLDGYVIKTTNGGETWTTVYHNPDIGFLGVAVADDSTTYVGGNNQAIFKTSDGGVTWTQMYTGIDGYTIRGGQFLNKDTGWMIGGTNGLIAFTNDGGMTWVNQDTIQGVDFLGIHFPTPNVGYVVGSKGTILRYGTPCPALPAIGGINGPTSVCAGDTLVFMIDSVPGANNYEWKVPSDAAITGGNGSTFITAEFGMLSGNVSVLAISDCDSVEDSLSVTVNPLPAIPVISFLNDTLFSNPAFTYQWYYNGVAIPGGTGQSYVPVQNGFYSVVVTNAAACEASSFPFDVIGLQEETIDNDAVAIQIFPNPMIADATILLQMGQQQLQTLSISDLSGRLIHEINISISESIVLTNTDLHPGIYFINLANTKHKVIARAKLVVE